MRWTINQVARALGVTPPPSLDPVARLAGVSIDSRAVGRGELFFAIHGPRHDGHAFVGAALSSGAGAAVVAASRLGDYPDGIREKLFAVPETLAALQQLAHAIRSEWGGRVAAVAGSVGKTTTKEILAALVAARFRVLKTEGNLNNEYGLPLTLAKLEPDHEAAVLELGMSRRGELARLTAIAEPQIGVITRIAVEHLEFFSGVDEIALAERELIEGLPGRDTVSVLNADDAYAGDFAAVAPGRVVTFGISPTADFRAEAIEDRGADGSVFTLVGPEGRARLTLSLVGRHNVTNALAALAASNVWGIGAQEAARILPRLAPAAMRGEVLRFEEGFTVINDCYNSSPTAVVSMIDLLASTPGVRRRILAAGEMLELGPTSIELHRESGRYAAAKRLDWIVGVQGDAAELVRAAVNAGASPAQSKFFTTSQDAAEFISALIEPGDLLLVKGSRGVRMERIIEAIRAKHALPEAAAGVSRGPERH
ncbi:MAG TPA: UDP-N-acetylmuramoyl-tripeptide--D-alanyl-D-alanine ligase [Candidatus Limnocylindrales bacterium]|nr:UDP-N-acetylmuramoyl-tripeptide--D-alanyl-D-alanine ligase [Candidatus Limnocylindrales bacterium]